MNTKKDTPESAPEISLNQQDKDKNFIPQYQTVFNSFKERPKTMLQVSIDTGILRANICRYIADMEERGIIQCLYKKLCPYTQYKAGFYSTNKDLFTSSKMEYPKLF